MSRTVHRKGTRLGAALALTLAFAATGSSAQAEDSGAGAHEGLEVEVRPAIVNPSGVVTVAAEYRTPTAAGSDDDTDEDTDDGSDDGTGDSGGGGGRSPRSAPVTPATAAGPAVVVDFGDGSAPTAMRVVGGGHEVKAFGQHAYAARGTYTVTVTATPAGGSPVSVPVEVRVGAGSARLSGTDRFETANRLAREDFPSDGDADAVLLARSDGFADALAAAPAAVLRQAPVLLSATAELPASVRAEITRTLGATGTVYVLGGPSAIAPSVSDELTAAGYRVVRIAGDDRVETALLLGRFLLDAGVEIDDVVLTCSSNFPDALSGAAYATSTRSPVLLTPTDALDPRVLAFLQELGHVEVHVAGAAGAVSDTVVGQLRAAGFEVDRISGDDRYATSAQIAGTLFPAATTVVLATGKNFPDALAGAPTAGRRGAPVLLVGDELSPAARAYLQAGAGRITSVYVLGGANAVPAPVLTEVKTLLGL